MPDWFLEPPKINLLPFLETEIKANFFQVQKTTFQIIRHLKTLGEFIWNGGEWWGTGMIINTAYLIEEIFQFVLFIYL